MKRLVYLAMCALGLSVLSFSAVGCSGGGSNTVIEDTRSQAEIDKEAENYEAEMEGQDTLSE